MARLTKYDARGIVQAICGDAGAVDFHRLTSGQVDDVLGFADSRGYRESKYANGSRARMFWQYVCRAAEGAEKCS